MCATSVGMQAHVAKAAGRMIGCVFAAAALVLGGFGMYLGRELRLNSRYIVTRPARLFDEVAQIIIHPIEHGDAYGTTGSFALVRFGLYALFVFVAAALDRHRAESRAMSS